MIMCFRVWGYDCLCVCIVCVVCDRDGAVVDSAIVMQFEKQLWRDACVFVSVEGGPLWLLAMHLESIHSYRHVRRLLRAAQPHSHDDAPIALVQYNHSLTHSIIRVLIFWRCFCWWIIFDCVC